MPTSITQSEMLCELSPPPNSTFIAAHGDYALGSVFSGTLMQGTDLFIDSPTPRWVEVEWTNEGRRRCRVQMRIAIWPSPETPTSLVLP